MTEVICYFLIENGVVIQKSYPFVEGWVEGPDYVAPGYAYVNGEFVAPPVPEPDWLALSTAEVGRLQRLTNAQITALQGRVNTLDFLINQQDPDDEEYMEPTDAEVAEFPERKAQLKSWNSYSAKLDRVRTQATWPSAPVWPTVPVPYTNETSAVAQAKQALA